MGDRAKLELPKKMSRPWIVNNAFEQEKLKDLLTAEKPVETNEVFSHIRETKKDKRKTAGTNRKYVRNINETIAHDNKNITDKKMINTATKTNKLLHRGRAPTQKTLTEASPRDAMDKTQELKTGITVVSGRCQDNDQEMEEKQRGLERDIELEQQQMMNKMFNSPTTFSSTFQVGQQLMPVMVHNPAGGYYIVHLPVHPPPPPPCDPTFYSFMGSPTTISMPSSMTSSISPPSSEDGYMDDSSDDICSLSEAFEENLEISDLESEEEEWKSGRVEEECPIEQDEELERLVLSIIEDN